MTPNEQKLKGLRLGWAEAGIECEDALGLARRLRKLLGGIEVNGDSPRIGQVQFWLATVDQLITQSIEALRAESEERNG